MPHLFFTISLLLGLGTSLYAESNPNILFFLADDWGRYASCYRDPARLRMNDVIETPNIDRVHLSPAPS